MKLFSIFVSVLLLSGHLHAKEQSTLLNENLACTEKTISVHCGKTPSVIFDKKGKLWAVFELNGKVYLTTSQDQGKTYSQPKVVNSQAEDIYTNGENRPKILIGKEQEIYVSWTKKTKGRFTGEIRFSRSFDQGKTFSPVITINDDGLLTSHRFESMALTQDGILFIAWLDKRDQFHAKQKAKLNKVEKKFKPDASIYYTYSKNSGKTFSKNYRLTKSTCVCCRMAITRTNDDNIALLWRHIFGKNVRDHAFTTFDENGVVSPMIRASVDNWKIDACPHHGPAIAQEKNDDYHLAWFTASDEAKGIFYKTLRNNPDLESAEAFNKINISNVPSASHPHIQVLDKQVAIVWKEFDGKKTQILFKQSNDSGKTWLKKQSIAQVSGNSDHPFLQVHNEQFWLNWKTDKKGLIVRSIK